MITSQLRRLLIIKNNLYSHTYDNKWLIKHGLYSYIKVDATFVIYQYNNYINKVTQKYG